MAVSKKSLAKTKKDSDSDDALLKRQEKEPRKSKKPAERKSNSPKKIISLVRKNKAEKVQKTPKNTTEKDSKIELKSQTQKKIFVLDTSVILYNHDCIRTFDDNDVALPITVLEELDNFKKGNDTINFEAREFIRIIDNMSEHATLTDWIPLARTKGGKFKVIMKERSDVDARKIFDDNKPDNRI